MAQEFKRDCVVKVCNKMQTSWFNLMMHEGDLPVFFNPYITPGQMLRFGVFEGKYMRDCANEYPAHMFADARFAAGDEPDAKGCNAFGAKSRNGLAYWAEAGWINPQDPRGWFEWYARYYLGRRSLDDARQIKRWTNFRPRFSSLVQKMGKQDITLYAATRQGLLQWAHDPLPDFPRLPGETVVQKMNRVLGMSVI